MFCKKCGSIMMPRKENGKIISQCLRCGGKEIVETAELKDKRAKKEKDDIEVVHNETEMLPVVDETCPKCGNDKAYFFTQQTRAADEPETKFYKCTKCGHTWRDYA